MAEQQISEMTTEQWEELIKTLPCAVVDFRHCDPDDYEDAPQEMHPPQKPD